MIRLNLIPEDYTKKPPSALPAVFAVLLVFLALGFFLFSDFTKLNARLNQDRQKLSQVEQQIKSLEEVENSLKRLEAEKDKLDKNKRIIDEVALSRLLWSRKLFELCSLVPEQIWLTQVEARKDRRTATRGAATSARGRRGPAGPAKVQEDTNLNISGIAVAPTEQEGVRAVGTFMNNLSGLMGLEGMPTISGVTREAQAQERHRLERRNKVFEKIWEQVLERVMADGLASDLDVADFDIAIHALVENLAQGVPLPESEKGSMDSVEDRDGLYRLALTPEAAKAIHASIYFGSDFFDAELVLLEDGEYLGKPVKSFTIQCRAIPRVVRTKSAGQEGATTAASSPGTARPGKAGTR